MEDSVLVIGKEFSGLSESNDSADSLDSSDGDDVLAAFKGTEFEDLFNTCQFLGIRSESFDSNEWPFDGLDRKCLASDSQLKSRSNINTSSSNPSLKKEANYFTERLHWNYRSARVSYDPRPISKRSRKRSIPDEMKDDAYWKKRCQNTERARKSREARRLKEIEVLQKVKTLEQEKLELQQEVDKLKEQLVLLNERLLKQEQAVCLFD